MLFGSQLDETASVAVMDTALELGIDFLDTANNYPAPLGLTTAGRSEEIVGRWLRGKRERVVVATKCAMRVGRGPNDAGGSRKHVVEACEQSLKRLQTDRIDVFFLHVPELGAPLEETFEALDHLVRQGKVLYVGVSNFETWRMALAFQVIAERRLVPIVAHQPCYNLLDRLAERELLPLCRAAGLGVVPYNPLGAGMLTGRYRRGESPPENSRFAQGAWGQKYQARYSSDRMFDVAEAITAVACAESMTPAQVALAWLLNRDGVTAPIVGASRPEQLRDCSGAVGRRLSPETLTQLDEVSAIFV
jgi:aryl-alcohol dehydrogenase (NADP+)